MTGIVRIDWRDRPVEIEHAWIEPADSNIARAARARQAEPIVFLHEGLGSLAMWKDFPQRLCNASGRRGLVWSRPGYGQSTPRDSGERWQVDFLHRQANEVLPALLAGVGIDGPVWLFGHSDGASISLIRAAQAPAAVAGAIVLAPHSFVEDVAIERIAQARELYEARAADGRPGLRDRLARYHGKVDSAFYGWNDIWLDPRFRLWTIVDDLASIRCPLLIVQGADDEYGTLEQVNVIHRAVPHARSLILRDCGHSPHVDHPQAVIDATLAVLDPSGAAAG